MGADPPGPYSYQRLFAVVHFYYCSVKLLPVDFSIPLQGKRGPGVHLGMDLAGKVRLN